MTEKIISRIEAIIISPAHNYVGHFGHPPGDHAAIRRDRVRLLPGRGIEGDRYSLRKDGHPKQITFFDGSVLEAMGRALKQTVPFETVRRNVFVRGLDLPSLVGKRFFLQGALFEGTEDCKPCFWMDQAVAPGAEAFLAGKGGLRARILVGETLSIGPAPFRWETDT